ncbi:conserved hypothetical protein [Talaromyces marneffei ATCC 18224]|uniref:Uncharacterized protein n=3 Tax=Talaromyces marneffei TaxID=37727 RepID=B6QNV1_TALMQ|nr:conserved hypothetical protein [Talaromyces marneffei ATCC 18224]
MYRQVKMSQAVNITEPNLLQGFCGTKELSSLDNNSFKLSPESASQLHQVKLVLLQPLANADMLKDCRDPNSRIVCRPNDSRCLTSNREYLNLQPLSKSWRQELIKITPIPELIFDLTLPNEGKENNHTFTKVYWDTAMPQEDSIGIHTRDVMTLVITIATEIRMRTNGDVSFEVIYDDTEGVSLKGMSLLKKQLLALSNNKLPIRGDEKEDF